ncbi:SHSP domain-containing protein [Mycena kentingensis (nom. inval.)]|nr:SHSP domain-containing protein [Mycena kentingensis (nom. inval.)]
MPSNSAQTMTPSAATSADAHVGRLLAIETAIRSGRVRLVSTVTPDTVFKPRMEYYDNPQSDFVYMIFEVPGVQSSEITINCSDGKLTVGGKRVAKVPIRNRNRDRSQRGQESMDVDSNVSCATESLGVSSPSLLQSKPSTSKLRANADISTVDGTPEPEAIAATSFQRPTSSMRTIPGPPLTGRATRSHAQRRS